MDSNSTNNQTPVQEPQVSIPANQKLSSEETFISDYEVFSKKPPKKFPYLWVILGIVIFLIIAGLTFYFLRTNKIVFKF